MSSNLFLGGLTPPVGVDFGSEKLRLTHNPYESVLTEDSVIVRNTKTDRIIAIGDSAADLRGRMPEHFVFVKPVADGVIANPSAAVTLLSRVAFRHRSWLESVLGQSFLIGVPASAEDTDVRTYADVFSRISSRSIRAVPASVAALLGVGATINDPFAQMVVDIGSETTNLGVVSNRSLIRYDTTDKAGRALDTAVQNYIQDKRNLHISRLQAQEIKHQSGACRSGQPQKQEVSVYGQDTASQLPREISVTSEQIQTAIQPTVDEITTFVQNFMQSLPSDTAADVYTNGVHLVGGTAQLSGLSDELSDVLSVPVYEYDNPEAAVVEGVGKAVDRPQIKQEITDFDPYATHR